MQWNSNPWLVGIGSSIIGGIIKILIKKIKLFGKIEIKIKNPKMQAGSRSGGKINRSGISIDLLITNDTKKNVAVKRINILESNRIINALGQRKRCNIHSIIGDKPVEIQTPLEVKYDSLTNLRCHFEYRASDIFKYKQAKYIGALKEIESCTIQVEYVYGKKEKIISKSFNISTTEFISLVRKWYKEADDLKGVIYIIDKDNE